MTPTLWQERTALDPRRCQALQKELGLHAVTARLLAMRGILDAEEAKRFLEPDWRDLPDPFLLKGMEEACQRIMQAIEKKEHILIYGDYDVDGVTSTSTLYLFLRDLGVLPSNLSFFIPHRITHGYGLQEACLPDVFATGCNLMITVDCGIASRHEVQLVRERGIDVIIIDHHQAPPALPEANAIINPHQPDCAYPQKILAAVGVVCHLLIALRKRLREKGYFRNHPEPPLNRYLDLVALGTVADIVNLSGVNRLLVQKGLQQIKKTEWLGLRALAEAAGIKLEQIDAKALGFKLGPRINAAGRMSDANAGVHLLTSNDFHQARSLAEILNRENHERQQIEREIFREARDLLEASPDMLSPHGIVIAHEGWHPGVIGIVASRLLDHYHRPVIVIALDHGKGKGSARSIQGFHLYQALKSCGEHLLQCGGHAAAAGLSIETSQLPAFREAFFAYAAEHLTPSDLQPRLAFDVEIDPSDISESLLAELERLEPHGMGNPEPVFVWRDLSVVEQKLLKEQHLKLLVQGRSQKRVAMGFFRSELYPVPPHIALAYRPEINEFNGRRSIQLLIKQLQPIG